MGVSFFQHSQQRKPLTHVIEAVQSADKGTEIPLYMRPVELCSSWREKAPRNGSKTHWAERIEGAHL